MEDKQVLESPLILIFFLNGCSETHLSEFFTTTDQIAFKITSKKACAEYPKHIRHLKRVHDPSILKEYPNLKILEMNCRQNESIEFLPRGLHSLKFSFSFNGSVTTHLPESLKILQLPGTMIVAQQILQQLTLPSQLESLDNVFELPKHLPETIKHISCSGVSIRQLSKGDLPHGLISFQFNSLFDSKLVEGVFPSTLEKLVFGDAFSTEIDVNVLPHSLKSLTFGKRYNQPLSKGILPNSLEHLKFGCFFNHLLEPGDLPNSIKTLEFGTIFNRCLSKDVLPNCLESLTFGKFFNQCLEPGVFPPSLTSLVFGSFYGQPLVIGVLPPNLKTLILSTQFQHSLTAGVLPQSLKFLQTNTKETIDLPPMLECFKTDDNLSRSNWKAGYLPPSIKKLDLGWFFNKPLTKNILPQFLEMLEITGCFSKRLNRCVLPTTLKVLSIDGCFNFNFKSGVLPNSIHTLILKGGFNRKIRPNSLPTSLKHLTFGDRFLQPFEPNILPNGLISLRLGQWFDQDLQNCLPQSLCSLTFTVRLKTFYREGEGKYNNDIDDFVYIDPPTNSKFLLPNGVFPSSYSHPLPKNLPRINFSKNEHHSKFEAQSPQEFRRGGGKYRKRNSAL